MTEKVRLKQGPNLPFAGRGKKVTRTVAEAEWICGNLYYANPPFSSFIYPQAA